MTVNIENKDNTIKISWNNDQFVQQNIFLKKDKSLKIAELLQIIESLQGITVSTNYRV
jgi:hypothetical protein